MIYLRNLKVIAMRRYRGCPLGALCTYCVGLYGYSPGIHCRILFLDIKLPLTKHYHKVCSAAYRFTKKLIIGLNAVALLWELLGMDGY